MSHTLLSKTGLQYLWGKLKAYFAKGNGKIFYGVCSTGSATLAKTVSCDAFTSSDLDDGSMVMVKFENGNTAYASSLTLNVNSTGAYAIQAKYNTNVMSLKDEGVLNKGIHVFVFHKASSDASTYWLLLDADTDTLPDDMTQAQITNGTVTTGKSVSPKLLRDNFYTETEVDTLMGGKKIWAGTQAEYDLLTPDADTLYFITESSS